MGACISSSSSSSADYSSRHRNKPSAYVVSVNGELRQYPLPITVSRVLQSETSSSFFLCNSDCLYFDDYIPSLNAQEELEAAQIYFVLPISKLNYCLAASDMAALAVKASVALQQINANSNNGLRRNRKARISPLLLVHDSSDHQVIDQQMKKNTSSSSSAAAVNYYYNYRNISTIRSSSSGLGVSRSSSVRKLTRYSSRRAKLAVRSFRIKLNTIYEGSQLIF